ncbi:MAG: Ig-like domain-containing protein, partial [Pseudomonadota bacterium]
MEEDALLRLIVNPMNVDISQISETEPTEVVFTFVIQNLTDVAPGNGDSDAITVTSLSSLGLGDLLAEAEAANGGPLVIEDGRQIAFNITREVTRDQALAVISLSGEDEQGAPVDTDVNDLSTFGTDGGELFIFEQTFFETIENVTEASATRTVAQVLRLPDDCGFVFLILNEDGTTTVEALLEGETPLSANAAALLGELDPGSLPSGAVAPDLPALSDLENASDGDVVGSTLQRIDEGSSQTSETVPQITEAINTIFLGDPVNDPFNVDVVVGRLFINLQTTTTTTQAFTDLTVTDQVAVDDVSIEEALTILGDDAALDDITAALEAKLEGDGEMPAINIIKSFDVSILDISETDPQPVTFTYVIQNTSDPGDGDPDAITVSSLVDGEFGDLLAIAQAANGGNPIVIPEGEEFTFSITRNVVNSQAVSRAGNDTDDTGVVVEAIDEEGDTASDAYSDGLGNIELAVENTVEEVTEVAATRTVAQVLRLPDDCGFVFLILNEDGSTSVQTLLNDGNPLSADAASLLGELDPGALPGGFDDPDLPPLSDLENASDGDVVGATTQRRDDGTTDVSETENTAISQDSDTAFIGNPETDPSNIVILIGRLFIENTTTTTTTQAFTDLTVTDQIAVDDVSIEEALAILGDDAALDDITAALEAKLEGDGELPAINLQKSQDTPSFEVSETDPQSVEFTYTIQNTSDDADGDPDSLTVTSLTDEDFGDILAEAEAANGGNPIVIPEGGEFTFTISRDVTRDMIGGSATVQGSDEENDVASDSFNERPPGGGGGGQLVISEGSVQETIEDVTELAATRTIAQVLRLPDDCGFVFLILNADGTTSVETMLNDGNPLSADSTSLLGELDSGSIPGGFNNPDLPDLSDLENATDGDVVGTNTQRRDDGSTETDETEVFITQDPGTFFLGNPETDPFEVQVIQGLLNIFTQTTTTTTNSFTDLTVTDQVAVDDVSIEEALTILGDDAALDDITAALEAKLDPGNEGELPAINLQKTQDLDFDDVSATTPEAVTFTYTIQNTSDQGDGDPDSLTVTSLLDDDFGDLLSEAQAANGGSPIVLAEGEAFTFSITRNVTQDQLGRTATVEGTDEENDVATDTFNPQDSNPSADGQLVIREPIVQETVEEVTDLAATRTVAQVLRLPDDCGFVFLILNEDGSTSVETLLDDGNPLSANASALLGELDPGDLPGGFGAPPLPALSDLENAGDGDVVGTDTQRRDDGQTSTTETDVAIDESPGTAFIGDPEADPFNIQVIIGLLEIDITTTTTTTQAFTDLTVTDEVAVDDVSIEEALAILGDDAALDDITAALEAKLDPGNQDPIAQDDALSTDEDTAINGSVFDDNGNGADSDPDGDTITVTQVNGQAGAVGSQIALASGALLTLNADGSYAYDPNGAFEDLNDGQSDTDSFTYTITDGNGGTSQATATIDIDGVTDDTGGGILNIEEVEEQVNLEEVIEASAARTVAQVLRLPDDCGFVFLILNEDGSTSVQTMLNDGNPLSADAAALLGDLDPGQLPAGALPPGLPALSDLENAGDGDVVGSDEQRIDGGSSDVVETQVDFFQEPGTLFTGDPVNDPFNVVVLQGVLNITITTTTTTTQLFTDLTVTDEVAVDDVSIEEALAILGDDAALDDITAALEAKLDPDENNPPLACDDFFRTDEDMEVSGNLFEDNGHGRDRDPDGDPLSVIKVNGKPASVGEQITLASGALLLVKEDGTFDYDPNGAFDHLNKGEEASDHFTYTISDGNGGTDTAKAEIWINGVDEPGGLPAVSIDKSGKIVKHKHSKWWLKKHPGDK